MQPQITSNAFANSLAAFSQPTEQCCHRLHGMALRTGALSVGLSHYLGVLLTFNHI